MADIYQMYLMLKYLNVKYLTCSRSRPYRGGSNYEELSGMIPAIVGRVLKIHDLFKISSRIELKHFKQ